MLEIKSSLSKKQIMLFNQIAKKILTMHKQEPKAMQAMLFVSLLHKRTIQFLI